MNLAGKARQLIQDPVLRSWLLRAALRGGSGAAEFQAHCPPYLNDIALNSEPERPDHDRCNAFATLSSYRPHAPIELSLPGQAVQIYPGEASGLYARHFSDIETMLSVYRFAWLPLAGGNADPAWVNALWNAFIDRFGGSHTGWAWHPYTVAERAINILDFSLRTGLPGKRDETLEFLALHATVIRARLEYFGDHNTSNHLANNGRGLYRLGLALGLPDATEVGKRILLNEATRIFLPSGVLREGSTHYHLLLTRNYADAYLAARAQERPEAAALGDIVGRALAILPKFAFVGGLPLVGDISPDCPPDFLRSLLPGSPEGGWLALRTPQERAALEALRPLPPSNISADSGDGWLRQTHGSWSTLWHVAPDGWPPMPGHAHQDMGSFETHWDDTPIVVDPGRGSYADAGESDRYVAGASHNSLTIDGEAPYPPNRPYYDREFRRRACGEPPRTEMGSHGLSISFAGFLRIRGVGEVKRRFAFSNDCLTIDDEIAGSRTCAVIRRLHTPWPVTKEGHAVVIRSPSGSFQVTADAPLDVTADRRWVAYGVPASASVISATSRLRLPMTLRMQLRKVSP